MQGFARAAVQTQVSLGFLNAGQSLVVTTGLIVLMAMAAQGVASGALYADGEELIFSHTRVEKRAVRVLRLVR